MDSSRADPMSIEALLVDGKDGELDGEGNQIKPQAQTDTHVIVEASESDTKGKGRQLSAVQEEEHAHTPRGVGSAERVESTDNDQGEGKGKSTDKGKGKGKEKDEARPGREPYVGKPAAELDMEEVKVILDWLRDTRPKAVMPKTLGKEPLDKLNDRWTKRWYVLERVHLVLKRLGELMKDLPGNDSEKPGEILTNSCSYAEGKSTQKRALKNIREMKDVYKKRKEEPPRIEMGSETEQGRKAFESWVSRQNKSDPENNLSVYLVMPLAHDDNSEAAPSASGSKRRAPTGDDEHRKKKVSLDKLDSLLPVTKPAKGDPEPHKDRPAAELNLTEIMEAIVWYNSCKETIRFNLKTPKEYRNDRDTYLSSLWKERWQVVERLHCLREHFREQFWELFESKRHISSLDFYKSNANLFDRRIRDLRDVLKEYENEKRSPPKIGMSSVESEQDIINFQEYLKKRQCVSEMCGRQCKCPKIWKYVEVHKADEEIAEQDPSSEAEEDENYEVDPTPYTDYLYIFDKNHIFEFNSEEEETEPFKDQPAARLGAVKTKKALDWLTSSSRKVKTGRLDLLSADKLEAHWKERWALVERIHLLLLRLGWLRAQIPKEILKGFIRKTSSDSYIKANLARHAALVSIRTTAHHYSMMGQEPPALCQSIETRADRKAFKKWVSEYGCGKEKECKAGNCKCPDLSQYITIPGLT